MVDSQQVTCSEVQFDEAFGRIVERRRRERGISTQQLAARCGVTISDIEQDPSQEQKLLNRCGSSTVPQVFVNGVHIGGANELGALETAGRLDELLNS